MLSGPDLDQLTREKKMKREKQATATNGQSVSAGAETTALTNELPDQPICFAHVQGLRFPATTRQSAVAGRHPYRRRPLRRRSNSVQCEARVLPLGLHACHRGGRDNCCAWDCF